VSVGPSDAGAIAADARNMPNIPSNSQSTVIANNPFIPPQSGGTMSMMDYLPEATRITQSGGKIVINANGANPYFKSVPTQAQFDSLGLKIEYQGSLLPEYQNMQFLRTDGSVMPSDPLVLLCA
jgi:filamentous hemagglutinin